jgi:hypothetical protein
MGITVQRTDLRAAGERPNLGLPTANEGNSPAARDTVFAQVTSPSSLRAKPPPDAKSNPDAAPYLPAASTVADPLVPEETSDPLATRQTPSVGVMPKDGSPITPVWALEGDAQPSPATGTLPSSQASADKATVADESTRAKPAERPVTTTLSGNFSSTPAGVTTGVSTTTVFPIDKDTSFSVSPSVSHRWPSSNEPRSTQFRSSIGIDRQLVKTPDTSFKVGVGASVALTDTHAAGKPDKVEIKFGPTVSAAQRLGEGSPVEVFADASLQFSRTFAANAATNDKLVLSGKGGLRYTDPQSKLSASLYAAGEVNLSNDDPKADNANAALGATVSIPFAPKGPSLDFAVVYTLDGTGSATPNPSGIGRSAGDVGVTATVKFPL